MKRILSPRVLIPTVVSLALFTFLIGFSEPHKLLHALALPPDRIGWVLGLMLFYEILRGGAWFLFLRRLDIQASLSEIAFCFSGGEVAKSLPGGVFFQNYLLNKVMGAHFSYSSGASTALLALEGTVTYLALLVMGLPLLPWLRPALGGLAGAFAIVVVLSRFYALPARLLTWASRHHHPRVRGLAVHLDQFMRGGRTLLAYHLLVPGLLLVALYLGANGMVLYTIGHQFAIPRLNPEAAMDVLAFSIFVPLIFPVPIQFGFTELTGLGALAAYGASRGDAIATMIAYRAWGMGLSMLFGITMMLLMPRQLAKALGKRSHEPHPPGHEELDERKAA